MKERKIIRLPSYDYGQNGCYFVTVCTQDKVWHFGLPSSVGAAPCGRPNVVAELAERWLFKIEEKYPEVKIDKYVIMPNHIHVIFCIEKAETGGHMGPPLPKIMDWYKTMTTNEYIRMVRQGKLPPFRGKLWQRSYYDHVIRNYDDYLRVWNYIESNPARWAEDEYYCGNCSMPQKTKES